MSDRAGRAVGLLVVVTAWLCLLDVCGPAKPKQPSAKPTDLVWPLPPERPRIKYLTTYRGVGDFGQKQSRWKSMLLGPEQPRAIEVLVKPYGVAADVTGRVYVTDTAARRVFRFDPVARDVDFVGEEGQGRLAKPIGVAVDDEGMVFVADATLNRVFGYGPDGGLAIAIGREGELENPSGMAIDRQLKRLYVADSKKHIVLCYSSADGSFIRTIGERGVDPGKFNFPTNIFVDRHSQLYVADTLNFRIQVFGPEGDFIREVGKQGDTPGCLNRPKGVGVDSEGHIYVADASFNNFQIFDSQGAILLFVGLPGRGPGQFILPAGLFVDDQDRIYVADQGNSRVQVFQYIRESAAESLGH
ncbi:MAG: 6-bladed beta-propeller [Acidobacteriota bacterium]